MSFQPVLPLQGVGGWRFLQRTMERQTESFSQSPAIRRDIDHFLARIGEVDTAEDLVSDRRLLRVALGAFGLQDDIDNRYFIRKILEEGTFDEGALANRLADDRYRKLSAAFGFGDFPTPSTKISDFGPGIVARFERQSFEVAVGQQDQSMRLALNAERELSALAEGGASDKVKWLRILGNPPLRQVFETAFRLPAGFGQMDLDRQVDAFRERTERLTGEGSVDQFAQAGPRERLIQTYLLQSQLTASQTSAAGTGALSMLQGAVQFAYSLRPG